MGAESPAKINYSAALPRMPQSGRVHTNEPLVAWPHAAGGGINLLKYQLTTRALSSC